MDEYAVQFNAVLVDTYRSVLRVEERTLRSIQNINLSISEMHMLEVVGKNKEMGAKIGEIARELGITMPSVTVGINKLMKKGYVQKVKSSGEGRMVYVTLTRLGKKMDSVHRHFHEQMVHSVVKDFTNEEKVTLLRGIKKLNSYLKQKIAEMEA